MVEIKVFIEFYFERFIRKKYFTSAVKMCDQNQIKNYIVCIFLRRQMFSIYQGLRYCGIPRFSLFDSEIYTFILL